MTVGEEGACNAPLRGWGMTDRVEFNLFVDFDDAARRVEAIAALTA